MSAAPRKRRRADSESDSEDLEEEEPNEPEETEEDRNFIASTIVRVPKAEDTAGVDVRNIVEGRRSRRAPTDPRKNPHAHYAGVAAEREELWAALSDFYEELGELETPVEKNKLLRDRPALWERIRAMENRLFDAKEMLALSVAFTDREGRHNVTTVRNDDAPWRAMCKLLSAHKNCSLDSLNAAQTTREDAEAAFLKWVAEREAGGVQVEAEEEEEGGDGECEEEQEDEEEEDDEDDEDEEDEGEEDDEYVPGTNAEEDIQSLSSEDDEEEEEEEEEEEDEDEEDEEDEVVDAKPK